MTKIVHTHHGHGENVLLCQRRESSYIGAEERRGGMKLNAADHHNSY
jgi:hypothetical protein